ncbi:MAG: hypothetical protein DCC53_04860 [Chloroflexi bacterium]|nr:MAG: hypothetical protein DCC53_04860 [Chloroflexota bacterium]
MIDYVSARASRPFTPLYPDADAVYSAQITLDVSTLEPLIALPDQPDRVVPVSQATGRPIQQAFVGTCTGGRYSDLAAAAAVVRGRKLRARLIVIPASAQVLSRAVRSGVLHDLIDAGAALGTPGCGPCMGNHLGVPAPNEATISTGSRNFRKPQLQRPYGDGRRTGLSGERGRGGRQRRRRPDRQPAGHH